MFKLRRKPFLLYFFKTSTRVFPLKSYNIYSRLTIYFQEHREEDGSPLVGAIYLSEDEDISDQQSATHKSAKQNPQRYVQFAHIIS